MTTITSLFWSAPTTANLNLDGVNCLIEVQPIKVRDAYAEEVSDVKVDFINLWGDYARVNNLENPENGISEEYLKANADKIINVFEGVILNSDSIRKYFSTKNGSLLKVKNNGENIEIALDFQSLAEVKGIEPHVCRIISVATLLLFAPFFLKSLMTSLGTDSIKNTWKMLLDILQKSGNLTSLTIAQE